ncbi:unnamed protein product [Symbiodinium natans]|uniref:Uncharacterized protein n=1 Tax=Symbiodinium natans TaxID=878477 RepID=A0A812LCH6_9DINO|nr:unnamed protein product [Symbiodinium natans]
MGATVCGRLCGLLRPDPEAQQLRQAPTTQMKRLEASQPSPSRAGEKCPHCDGWGYAHPQEADGILVDLEEHGRCAECADCEACSGTGLVLARQSMGRRRTATAKGLPGVEALRALQ